VSASKSLHDLLAQLNREVAAERPRGPVTVALNTVANEYQRLTIPSDQTEDSGTRTRLS